MSKLISVRKEFRELRKQEKRRRKQERRERRRQERAGGIDEGDHDESGQIIAREGPGEL